MNIRNGVLLQTMSMLVFCDSVTEYPGTTFARSLARSSLRRAGEQPTQSPTLTFIRQASNASFCIHRRAAPRRTASAASIR